MVQRAFEQEESNATVMEFNLAGESWQALHIETMHTQSWPAAYTVGLCTREHLNVALDLETPPVMLSLSIQMGSEAGVLAIAIV
jgi:hypothetical protein